VHYQVPGIVHAISQVLIRFPAGRALPKKFFGGHIGKVVFVVRDLKDALIDLCAIVHGVKWLVYLCNC